MKVKYLRKQGNSFGVVLDRTILALADMKADMPLKISVDNGRIVLEPLTAKRRSGRQK